MRDERVRHGLATVQAGHETRPGISIVDVAVFSSWMVAP